MAFDGTLPLDDGHLAEAPGQLREQFRALKDDKIINAGKLKGLEPGNASGNVPINNGTLNTDLNADKLDGHDSAYFSASTHTHAAATTNAAGLMSAADKVKLNGIAAGAEVNQNAFAKIKAGSVVIEADQKQDTLELVAGSNITITPDTANDKLTIALPPTISANTSGDAATCNGCGRVAPTELTDDNAMSHLESGFYRTEGNATEGGAGGRKYSAIIQAMRGSARGGRIIFGVWPDNTKLDVRAQAFNGTWGPLKTFVMQGDAFSGNAASATKLQTSRRINGVLFNGTGDITITAAAKGGTSAACSGNAATATRLQTARTINGVFFNGTGDIAVVPIGSIIAFPGNTPPSHTILANGANVSRTQYAKLFAVYGTKYGAGDGSTTFKIPDCRNRVLQGDTTAGTYKQAGLPNITGMFGYAGPNPEQWTINGAFWRDTSVGNGVGWYRDDNHNYLKFDASKSNSIYGKSNTVQPPALTVLYCIVYE